MNILKAPYIRAKFIGKPPHELQLTELSIEGTKIEHVSGGSAWVSESLLGEKHTSAEVTFSVLSATILSKGICAILLNNEKTFLLHALDKYKIEYDGADIDCSIDYGKHEATLFGHIPVIFELLGNKYYIEV